MPLLAVSFALFQQVPGWRPAGAALREHLVRALLPPEGARLFLQHLTRFLDNTQGLPLVGFAFLLVSALALVWSVEGTLNRIWRATRPRPLWRRLALHAVLLLLAPACVGASLWATAQMAAWSAGLLPERRPWWPYAVQVGPVLLAALGFTLLFRMVPHTDVRWRQACVAGLLAGAAFELGKRGFALFLLNLPVQRTLYGALAPLLVFLMWVYYSWITTLGAALVGASVGGGNAGRRRRT